jgi:hypothetical protein
LLLRQGCDEGDDDSVMFRENFAVMGLCMTSYTMLMGVTGMEPSSSLVLTSARFACCGRDENILYYIYVSMDFYEWLETQHLLCLYVVYIQSVQYQ